MRIRKNAKLSSLINSTGSRVETVHVCELNQSPWDVIPFAQEPYPSYLHHQFEPEDNFNGNESLGDSVGTVKSVASMIDNEDKSIMKVERMVIDEEEETKIGDQFGFKTQREDEGKGSKQDCSLKSYFHDNGNNPSSSTSKRAGNRRERAGTTKKGQSSASNPYELYYYSRFRPSWRRRRGGNEIRENIIVEGKDVENNSNAVTTQNNNTTSSSSFTQFDYDDDEENDEDSGGKKQMRKPIKARSLKSLM
ncbi:Syntaxin of plants 71 [Hibiscus syriacus]|uniref:Syntaxin of plants 71 n=2 Tax=Hibiscus syriacus TaxID=106335 RepID=A0A6A2WVT3_HIBSY|nr:Syntaxin of plants 71 [Hibiscus syriacus]